VFAVYAGSVVTALFIALACLGVGSLFNYTFPDDFDWPGRLGLSFCLGLGVLGTVLFLIGLFQWNTWIVAGLLSPAALLAVWRARRVLPGFLGAHPTFKPDLRLVPVAICALFFIAALAPPSLRWSDGVFYHLLGPKVWLRDGYVHPVLDDCRTAFPAITEMAYACALALGNVRSAALLGLLFLVAELLLVWSIVRQLGGSDRACALATALASTMQPLFHSAITGYVDTAYSCFALASALLAVGKFRSKTIPAVGVLLGSALGSKYTGALLLVATVPVMAVSAFRATRQRHLLLVLMGVPLVAVLVASPWYLRNQVVLGAAIYPPMVFGMDVPVRAMTPGAVRAFYENTHIAFGLGLGRGLRDFVLLPYRLTYIPAKFAAGGIGLAVMAFLPLAVALYWKRWPHAAYLGWAFVGTILWFLSSQQGRFLAPFLAAGTVLAALAADWLLSNSTFVHRLVVWIAVGVSIAYGFGNLMHDYGRAITGVAEGRFHGDVWKEDTPFADGYEFVNGNPSVRRVLLLGQSLLPFFIDKPYVKAVGIQGETPLFPIQTNEEALHQWRLLGVSHVFDSRPFVAGSEPGLRLVFSSADARIYEGIAP